MCYLLIVFAGVSCLATAGPASVVLEPAMEGPDPLVELIHHHMMRCAIWTTDTGAKQVCGGHSTCQPFSCRTWHVTALQQAELPRLRLVAVAARGHAGAAATWLALSGLLSGNVTSRGTCCNTADPSLKG